MKKILFLSLFIGINSFGQSVQISPDKIQQKSSTGDNDIDINRYGSFGILAVRTSGGTLAAPTNTPAAFELFRVGAGGYVNSAFTPTRARISFTSTEAWTNTGNGAKMTFRTTPNGTSTDSERMVIDHNGRVGIGLSSPNQILDINGRMRIRHTPGFTSGVWMSNSTNGLGDADGAFIGLENDNQAGIWINNAWRFGFKSNGNAVITGFTQLGNSTPAGASPGATAPAIKTLKLTGTTAGAAGASISVDHGLGNRLKILGYTVLVVGTSAVSYPPEYTYNGGYQYSTTCSNTQILIINSHLNSANIYNKAFTVLITYEE